ncbi:putative mitochondrial hypothetical protein [Leptomonas pyrrhocoris]|uniref:Uncharacterized protein n=1 Tax=Leptomonas pyrrhocoris TaxID=157538 RepID=A0A0M9FRW5_LEPPY|nr:putative mitochondrial hypothetical protein [Leptomonas pyrrhocoris]KPA74679.1 putative mitochondrial hypothetical protein [Leptomonas pyrrhocoris]|eukprot:XP_015653118.1 putative mitochondrial hypothetical protein [Leptomonas pyrrhocoris]
MTAAAKVARVVSSRLRVIQRDYLTRRGGRTHHLRSSVAVDYTPAYFAAYKADPNLCPRLIDAEAIHGDEQAFWSARRDFYRGGASRSYYPTWDRQAQALVMLTREVARVPQEAAFRLFTLGLKMLLLPRLVTNAELMLPSWVLMNTEGPLGAALEGTPKTAAESGGDKSSAANKENAKSEGSGGAPVDGAGPDTAK